MMICRVREFHLSKLAAIFFPQQLRFASTASPEFGFNSLKRCSGTILMNNS